MTAFEKIIQIITAVISTITFVWGIVSAFIVYNQNKKLTKLQGYIDRGNHVSKVVFDTIFETFQVLSKSMFECYNIAGRELFPYYENAITSIDNPRFDIMKMEDASERARYFLNQMIETVELNRFILSQEILEEVRDFELKMKMIMCVYSEKKEQLRKFPAEKEEEMKKVAEELQSDYQNFTDLCYDYIQELQIVD